MWICIGVMKEIYGEILLFFKRRLDRTRAWKGSNGYLCCEILLLLIDSVYPLWHNINENFLIYKSGAKLPMLNSIFSFSFGCR